MPLDLATLLPLAAACAPTVAPQTLLSIAQVESGFDPLAIGVNGPGGGGVRPRDAAEAVQRAKALIAAGRNIDLGLAQINVRNLGWLRLSVEQAFDPCRNLAAAAEVLTDGYRRAAAGRADPQAALRTALSFYNTGDPERGLRNGYVAKVTRSAATLVPALQPDEGQARTDSRPRRDPPKPALSQPPPEPWDVFGRARLAAQASFVLSPPSGNQP